MRQIVERYAILSDVHGNMHALTEVMREIEHLGIEKIILLGDLIDYGMQSNEVVEYISRLPMGKIVCNVWGNHEKAILTGDYQNFSSQRGRDSAKYTASLLTEKTRVYLLENLRQDGKTEFCLGDKHVLAVHGSRQDCFWKAISPEDLHGEYQEYDIVLSGHSHYPHVFQKFYSAKAPAFRNKKSVLFINPGSVGQPRNHNANAQYAILDMSSMSVNLRAVPYPKEKAMGLYHGEVDDFYRERLQNGI